MKRDEFLTIERDAEMDTPLRKETTENALKGVRTNIVQSIRAFRVQDLQDAAGHNVRHAELFWNPTGTARESGIAYPQAQDGLLAAVEDARRDFGIDGRLIPAMDREADPAAALEMVRWVIAQRDECVPGISPPPSELLQRRGTDGYVAGDAVVHDLDNGLG